MIGEWIRMRALAEEFLLRHLNDGAIICGLLLRLNGAAIFLTLNALCRGVLSSHCELEEIEVEVGQN